MRRKLIILLLILLLILLILLGAFAVWTWYQMNINQSLKTGNVQPGTALGGLVIPQTAVLYGVLSGFFLSLTIASIWITYRLVRFPPNHDEEE